MHINNFKYLVPLYNHTSFSNNHRDVLLGEKQVHLSQLF